MEIEAFAPGKVILHGEHAVVYGSKAIAISVGLNTRVKVSHSEDAVKLKFIELGIDLAFTTQELDELRNVLKTKSDFSFGCLNDLNPIPLNPEMLKCLEEFVSRRALINCKEELRQASKSALEASMFLYLVMFEISKPIEIFVTTELPVGAGLGSSASFGVALVGALLLSSGKMRKDAIDKDMINRWAFASECFVHGNPSGIDNSVVTYGGAVLYQKGQPMEHLNCSGIRVLLVNTQVPRSTKTLVARLGALKEKNPAWHKGIMDSIHELVEKVAIELKETGQTKPEFVAKNQEYLNELQVSHPKIDLIVDIAKQHNLSAKLTGAGGGGCVFIQIPETCTEKAVDILKSSLIDNGLTMFWYITLGGDGFHAT